MDLLAQMTTFLRVVDGGSLSAAARAQRLSLAAVSRQLRALEEDLGVALLVRSTRHLQVTDAGRAWYDHCLRVLREVERGRESVRADASASGSLVISASVTLGARFVVPFVPALVKKNPRLELDLRLEDRPVDLVGEGVDVAIRGGIAPPDSTAFVAHPVVRFRRVLVASPGYLRRAGAPKRPEQLATHACLLQAGALGASSRWTLADGHEERHAEVRGPIRTTTPTVLRDLAHASLGIAFLPEWLVADDLEAGALRRVLAPWTSLPVTAWAIHRTEQRGSRRIQALLDVLPSIRSGASTTAAHDDPRLGLTRARGAPRTAAVRPRS
jgi:DNA-binding transcriptional LysR family regulator